MVHKKGTIEKKIPAVALFRFPNKHSAQLTIRAPDNAPPLVPEEPEQTMTSTSQLVLCRAIPTPLTA